MRDVSHSVTNTDPPYPSPVFALRSGEFKGGAAPIDSEFF